MDNLALDGEELRQALDGLSAINTVFGNTSATFNAVKKELLKKASHPLRIIDLGCGGGDNLRRIAHWCTKNNIEVVLFGIDGNVEVLKYAKGKSNSTNNITYQQADILAPSFEIPTCDILISSHFMYHFTDDALCLFLKRAKKEVSHTIIFSDLYRSNTAFLLMKWFGFLIPFGNIVRKDGLKAIQRSFKKKELETILSQAEITPYVIRQKWAFRYLLHINTKQL